MHILDSYINDIEPRILAVCDNSPKQEDVSLQEALASYGWILLDSWIAWRTLRFLTRDLYIEESVQGKWFQTPSSYTAGQLRAAWKFSDLILDCFKTESGKSFNKIINDTIQSKRNASAHFSKRSAIQGVDTIEIKKLYSTFSKIFLFYEVKNFLNDTCLILKNDKYSEFRITFNDSTGDPIAEIIPNSVEFDNVYEAFSNCDSYLLSCKNSEAVLCKVNFMNTGCDSTVMIDGKDDHSDEVNICNSEHERYNFFSNKGYYRDVGLFVSTIEKTWSDIITM